MKKKIKVGDHVKVIHDRGRYAGQTREGVVMKLGKSNWNRVPLAYVQFPGNKRLSIIAASLLASTEESES